MINLKSAVARLFSNTFIMNRDTSVYRSSSHWIIETLDNKSSGDGALDNQTIESLRYYIIKVSVHQIIKQSLFQVI